MERTEQELRSTETMAKDPYKYFRIEARELLDSLSRGVMELEKGVPGKELVSKVLRYAHTLKGASRVVKQPELGELAHKVEEVLAPYREGTTQLPPEHISQMLALLDSIGVKLGALASPEELATQSPQPESHPVAPPPTPPSAAPAGVPPAPAKPSLPPLLRRATDDRFETVRVEIKEMDALLEAVARVELQLAALRSHVELAEGAHELAVGLAGQLGRRGPGSESPGSLKAGLLSEQLCQSLQQLRREMATRIEQASAELLYVRGLSNELRLLPASSIFGQLERSVRDAAQSQNKKVSFAASGGEIRLDAHVLAALRDAQR